MGVDGTVILKASLDFQKFALHSSGFLCSVFFALDSTRMFPGSKLDTRRSK